MPYPQDHQVSFTKQALPILHRADWKHNRVDCFHVDWSCDNPVLTHITVVALENIVDDPFQWLTNRCGASYFVRWYISYMIFSLYGGTLDCGLPEGESKP